MSIKQFPGIRIIRNNRQNVCEIGTRYGNSIYFYYFSLFKFYVVTEPSPRGPRVRHAWSTRIESTRSTCGFNDKIFTIAMHASQILTRPTTFVEGVGRPAKMLWRQPRQAGTMDEKGWWRMVRNVGAVHRKLAANRRLEMPTRVQSSV